MIDSKSRRTRRCLKGSRPRSHAKLTLASFIIHYQNWQAERAFVDHRPPGPPTSGYCVMQEPIPIVLHIQLNALETNRDLYRRKVEPRAPTVGS
jgi:hypothetical protein